VSGPEAGIPVSPRNKRAARPEDVEPEPMWRGDSEDVEPEPEPEPEREPMWWRGEQMALPGMPAPPVQLTIPPAAEQLHLPGLSRAEMGGAEIRRIRRALTDKRPA
jgi:hypothetical protein